jgi:hypothetical protein
VPGGCEEESAAGSSVRLCGWYEPMPQQPASESASPVDSVRNEHDVLVPGHQLPLARGAADDKPLHAAVDLQAAGSHCAT